MNNEELIAKFLETHGEYKPRKDYLLVDSDGYVIICVFNTYLMIHFNAWLMANFRDNGRLVLLHCTTRTTGYIKKYNCHMRKVYKSAIKCYAFKKDKCVLDMPSDKKEVYGFDECTFWVSKKTNTKILKFHSRQNYIIDEEDERLAEGVFPINALNILAECSKLRSTNIIQGIDCDRDVSYFVKKEKKLIEN